MKKSYRIFVNCQDLVPFRVKIKESDLFILSHKNLSKIAEDFLLNIRLELEGYIETDPIFAKSFVPLKPRKNAPEIVKIMCEAAQRAGVGPMAAVAGTISELMGKFLKKYSEEVIVENGGDIYISSSVERTVAIWAASSVFSGKLGLKLSPGEWGVATSSGVVGHSLSFGKADAAVVVAKRASLADAFATALGNRVRDISSVKEALNWIASQKDKDLVGAVVVFKDNLGVWGDVELVKI